MMMTDEKRIHPGRALLAIAAGIAALSLAMCGLSGILKLGGGAPVYQPAAREVVSSTFTVTYRVSGYRASSPPEGSIIYANEGGGTEMQGEERFPWEKSFSAKPGAFIYVSVQNKHDYGSVKCEILVNGQVVKESSSNGAYVIATCSGRL